MQEEVAVNSICLSNASNKNASIECLAELELKGIGFVGHEETDSRDPVVGEGQVFNIKLGCFSCIEHIVQHGIRL